MNPEQIATWGSIAGMAVAMILTIITGGFSVNYIRKMLGVLAEQTQATLNATKIAQDPEAADLAVRVKLQQDMEKFRTEQRELQKQSRIPEIREFSGAPQRFRPEDPEQQRPGSRRVSPADMAPQLDALVEKIRSEASGGK